MASYLFYPYNVDTIRENPVGHDLVPCVLPCIRPPGVHMYQSHEATGQIWIFEIPSAPQAKTTGVANIHLENDTFCGKMYLLVCLLSTRDLYNAALLNSVTINHGGKYIYVSTRLAAGMSHLS